MGRTDAMRSLRTRAVNFLRDVAAPSTLSGGVCAAGLAALLWPLNRGLAGARDIAVAAFWLWAIYTVLFVVATAAYRLAASRVGWPRSRRDVLSLHLAGGFFVVFFEMLEPAHQTFSSNPHLTLVGFIDLGVLALLSALVVAAARRRRRRPLAAWGIPAAVVAGACLAGWGLSILQEPERSRTAALADVEAALAQGHPRAARAATASPRDRVLLLAIDGADWAAVGTLVRDGRLPAFARLLAGGDAYELDNLGYAYSAPIWASLYTGIESPESGVYDFVRCRFPGAERAVLQWPRFRSLHTLLLAEEITSRIADSGVWACPPTDSGYLAHPPLWSIAAAHGRRTLVVNPLPFASIPENLDGGTFVWLGEDRYVAFEGRAPRKVGPSFKAGPSPAANVTVRERAQLAATVELMRAREFDLVIYYTHFLDAVQHYNHRLAAASSRTPTLEALARSGIAAAYEDADRSIAELVEAFGSGTVMLVSDHGWVFSDYEHFHSPLGMLVVSPGRSPGARGRASLLRIAPSVLALLTVPATVGMASPLPGIADPRRIESFAGIVKREYLMSDGPAMDPERVRWLRSLGYLW